VSSGSLLWSTNPHTHCGFDHLYNHEYEEAIDDFELAAQAHPNDPFAVNHLLTAVPAFLRRRFR
jgi:hypothetical protein